MQNIGSPKPRFRKTRSFNRLGGENYLAVLEVFLGIFERMRFFTYT